MNFKPFECGREARVIEAARTGAWEPELRQHASACPACSEAALAARVLNEMAAVDMAEARIPDAGLMWWKAQLLAKREAAERATQPINFVERFAYAWAVVCVVGVCIWQWAAIRAWIGSLATLPQGGGVSSIGSFASHFSPNAALNWFVKSPFLQGSGLVMMVSAGVLIAFVAFATYLTRSEE